MSSIVRWLIRQRDRCSVSYSRFGLPGDPVDDHPPPREIVVPDFDDNHPDFIYMRFCHVQKAAVLSAGFGMSFVILMFISAFFEFDWYSHDRGIDIIALLSLFFYLCMGVLVHYYVILGIKRHLSHYLVPFLVIYLMVIASEVVAASYHFSHFRIRVQLSLPNDGDGFLLFVVLSFLVVIFVQGNMVAAVARCRLYLSRKQMHEIALKIAERAKTKNPELRIVFASELVNVPTISRDESNVIQGGAENHSGVENCDGISGSGEMPPPSYATAVGFNSQTTSRISELNGERLKTV